MKLIKRAIRSLLRKLGYDVYLLKPKEQIRDKLVDQITSSGINVVFDIGANAGQFGKQLRDQGYTGKIISFEPVKATFKLLERASRDDVNWIALNIALGEEPKIIQINVSENTWSSSFRPLEEKIIHMAPTTQYVSTEQIGMETLDNIFSKYVSDEDRVFLKMDVQGYENEVLKGAEVSLRKIEGILSEASLTHHYKGEWLLHELMAYLVGEGFMLFDLREAFRDNASGQLIQVDALFWHGGFR